MIAHDNISARQQVVFNTMYINQVEVQFYERTNQYNNTFNRDNIGVCCTGCHGKQRYNERENDLNYREHRYSNQYESK